MHFAFGLVYRNLVVVDAETIALSIAVYKEAALQELVRREADARYDMGRRKCGLLYLCKIVLRIAVQFQYPYFMERIFLMAPDLRNVEWILIMLPGLFLRHDLDIHCPAWIIALFNGFI